MGLYRKRPIVISAVQLLPDAPTPAGVNFGWPTADNEHHHLEGLHWVRTLEGPLIAQYNDWIITGVKGEHYPVKPDIFAATYDEVVE